MNLFSTNAYGHAEPTRHAANADPDTSHEAAINMEVSGKLNRHCEIVLGIIRRQPGTYPELWEAATPEEKAELRRIDCLQRRLADLLHEGRIRRMPKRKCTVNTNSTMQPVEAVYDEPEDEPA